MDYAQWHNILQKGDRVESKSTSRGHSSSEFSRPIFHGIRANDMYSFILGFWHAFIIEEKESLMKGLIFYNSIVYTDTVMVKFLLDLGS